eukprot:TRINITY_DN91745_c0_g1_i1.p1 TRINITY_DN91745_c0_g1~~TRINITY_DN91745_c0_g1_i1.p1  ORF type:complete len:285 (-),score=46.10 TRINITY_DN91745_c0_g1_i1:133-936(-)
MAVEALARHRRRSAHLKGIAAWIVALLAATSLLLQRVDEKIETRCWLPLARVSNAPLGWSDARRAESPDVFQQPVTQTNRRTVFRSAAAIFAASLLGLASPEAGRAKPPLFNEENPDGNPIAMDLRIPPLPAEEVTRRRTTPVEELAEKKEKWYVQGRGDFLNRCAGCHASSREADSRLQDQLLSKEYFEKIGGINEKRIEYGIRYGKGRMPGYAADCEDLNDEPVPMCRSVNPLSEERLRGVQDFMYNRMNFDWKTEAPDIVRRRK